MARVATHGFEIGVPLDKTPEGNPTGTVTRDTGTFRSGVAAAKCDSGAGNAVAYVLPTFVSDFTTIQTSASTTYYARAYLNFPALPTANTKVAFLGASVAGIGVSARLTTGGKLQLWNNSTNLQIGGDSAATIAAGSTWYRIELSGVISAAPQLTACELRLDGVTVASTSGLTEVQPFFGFGWLTAPGANKVCYLDDVAVNDNSGGDQNSWPGDGKIVLLKPISDSAVGASWTDDAAGTTNIWDAVTNTPPAGIADTTSGSGLHQIRNAASNSSSYDANLTTYATAGLGVSDTVNVLVPLTATGAPVVTGAKTGSIGIASNPTIANIAFVHGASAAANFWSGAAAGTYLTNWKWEAGTVTYASPVTVATSPVARVTITGGTAARIAMVCFLGMYIDYTPHVTPIGQAKPFAAIPLMA